MLSSLPLVLICQCTNEIYAEFVDNINNNNKFPDRSMEISALLGNYGRPTDQQTKPTDQHTVRKGHMEVKLAIIIPKIDKRDFINAKHIRDK